MNLPTKWSYKGKPYESDHVMHCMFCKLWRVVALPPDLLAEQPDDTTHVCLNCGHGFAIEKEARRG